MKRPKMRKLTAEFIGTFWLVLGGCGSAVLAATFPEVGIGLVGVSLAFGLTVLTIAYSLGHISGAHLNPAVSIGLWAGGRFSSKDLFPYISAQILGALLAAGVLYVIATGNGSAIGNFARQRIWRALAWQIQPGCGFGLRNCNDIYVPDCNSWGYRQKSACRFCRVSHWFGSDADPPHQHSGNQHFCKSCPKHQSGRVCWWLGC